MRKITQAFIIGQTLIIIFIKIVDFYFHNSGNIKWIVFGEELMNYRSILMLTFILISIITFFIREKWWPKIIIFCLTVIGLFIVYKLWLSP